MRGTSIFVVAFLLVVGLSGSVAAEEGPAVVAAEVPVPGADANCVELVEMGEPNDALIVCREEFEEAAQDPAAIRRLAELEFKFGDPGRSVELWSSLIDLEGWTQDAASGQAMALWRAGEKEEAEKVFRKNLERGESQPAYTDLISFLLAFSRWPEAAEVAAAAMTAYPETCGYAELGGVAKAGQDDNEGAAELFAKAIENGCPPYRWTTLGPVPQHLDNPAYHRLIKPAGLVEGIREVSDRECEQRFQLLALVVTADVAQQITNEVLLRDKLEVRFEGIGLLSQLGSSVLASWQKLLADDDFVLRKYTLRRIRELRDPAFIPLVEEHLGKEKSKSNLALTRLTLAELLLVQGDAVRAEALVREIPNDDSRFAVGLTSLANSAEERGDIGAALRFFDEALAADSEVYVDRERLAKLRADVEHAEAAEPEDADD